MFGSQKKIHKVKSATNSVSLSGTQKEHRTHSQKKRESQGHENTTQMELIAQQKQEIENLKATQATGKSTQQLVNAMLQAMSCLYVGNKKTLTDNPSNGGKTLVGTPRPSKSPMGIERSLDVNLTYQYCKDTGNELDNCKWPLQTLAHKCTAMQSIAT